MDNNEDRHVVVEMITTTTPITTTTNETYSELEEEETSSLHDEISPLLANKPKINIFSLPYSRRKSPREEIKRVVEVEVSIFSQFILWVWNGSKYSGYLCMAMSASIYFLMHILSDSFSVRSIPLFETIFTRCTIILISSFVWLKMTGQPVYGPPHVRSMLMLRSLMGCLSLFSFVYSVQSLSLSQAIVLNFTTPVMASIAARIFLQEKLKLADVGGLACSFFGLLFIFRPMLITQGGLVEIGEASASYVAKINHPVYAVCAGLFSAITGGISYCFIQTGAKTSDQPVVTVYSFANLACPAAAICMYGFQKIQWPPVVKTVLLALIMVQRVLLALDFVLPDIYSFLLMIILGVLSFFAEVLLARGLQLQKISRVANIQYIEVVLLQLWSISLLRATLSFGRLAGCLLILLSVSGTMYFGHEKEME